MNEFEKVSLTAPNGGGVTAIYPLTTDAYRAQVAELIDAGWTELRRWTVRRTPDGWASVDH